MKNNIDEINNTINALENIYGEKIPEIRNAKGNGEEKLAYVVGLMINHAKNEYLIDEDECKSCTSMMYNERGIDYEGLKAVLGDVSCIINEQIVNEFENFDFTNQNHMALFKQAFSSPLFGDPDLEDICSNQK